TRPARLFHGHYHIPYIAALDCGDSEPTSVVGLADDDSTMAEHTLVLTRDGL
ncbi:MAG: hypothetical protein JWR13_1810, partial [Mycobacterium sp.]|nr:hypothetical protein [Mycobacterium sp.]